LNLVDILLVLFLPRDAMQAPPVPSRGVRPSVCPSVTFVDSVETNKHKPDGGNILKIYLQNFSTVG